MGKHAGDLYIQASSGSIISTQIFVEDLLKYDDASSDKTSNYDTSNLSGTIFAYDATNSAYKMQCSGFEEIFVPSLTVGKNVKISVDFKIEYTASGRNTQPRPIILDNSQKKGYGLVMYNYSSTYAFRPHSVDMNGNITQLNSNGSWSNSNWYTLEMTVESNSITFKAYNGSTEIYSYSTTPSLLSDSNIVGIQGGFGSTNLWWKNLKIEEL